MAIPTVPTRQARPALSLIITLVSTPLPRCSASRSEAADAEKRRAEERRREEEENLLALRREVAELRERVEGLLRGAEKR